MPSSQPRATILPPYESPKASFHGSRHVDCHESICRKGVVLAALGDHSNVAFALCFFTGQHRIDFVALQRRLVPFVAKEGNKARTACSRLARLSQGALYVGTLSCQCHAFHTNIYMRAGTSMPSTPSMRSMVPSVRTQRPRRAERNSASLS